jgi:transcriptional regulator with XRE-family HTH domain
MADRVVVDIRRLVGRNVRRIRLAKGLTQERFADRSGFAQQYLSDLERGRRNPTVVTLFELAAALGVDHVELVAPDAEVTSTASNSTSRAPKRHPGKSRKSGL